MKSPKVLGALSIFFGVTTTMFDCLSLLAAFFNNYFSTDLPPYSSLSFFSSVLFFKFHDPSLRSLIIFSAIFTGLKIVYSIVLVYLGVRLLQKKPGSAEAAINWSIAALVYLAVYLIGSQYLIQKTIGVDSNLSYGFMQPIFSSLLSLPFPVLLLALLPRLKSGDPLEE